MGLGALNYQGVKGGLKLNDVIEEFKYAYKGQQIKVGEFVNFVNGVGSKTIEGTNTSNTIPSAYFDSASAVVLDENRVFLASGKQGFSNGKLNCVVLSINGAEIIVNTVYSYATTSSPTDISATLLDANKVVISMREGNVATAIVAGITNTTIGLGSSYTIGTGDSSYYDIDTQIVALSTTTALMCWDRYRNNSSTTYGLKACILTIGSGASKIITAGTTANITGYLHDNLSLCKLNDTTAFLTSSYGRDVYYGEGVVITMSGTTVYYGSVHKFTSNSISLPKSITINENTALVGYTISGSGVVQLATIDASTKTPTFGTAFTAISGFSISSLLLIDTNKVLISYGSRNFLVAEIIDDTITFYEDGLYSLVETNTNYLTTAKIKNEKVIAVYQNLEQANKYDYDNYGTSALLGIDGTQVSNVIASIEYETQVTLATEPPFDGIALSNGVGGDDTAHNEQVKIAKPIFSVLKDSFETNSLSSWVIGEEGNTVSASITNQGHDGKNCCLINYNDSSYPAYYENAIYHPLSFETNHKYYWRLYTNILSHNTGYIRIIGAGWYIELDTTIKNSWVKTSKVHTMSSSDYIKGVGISFKMVDTNSIISTKILLDDVAIYDLTSLFGAGNEPTQEWCDANL